MWSMQLAEAFASKLFALSYGFTSLEVHSGSGVGDFVHRYTHRVTRGLLLIVGRPGKWDVVIGLRDSYVRTCMLSSVVSV